MINDSYLDESNQASAGWSLVNFGVNDDPKTSIGFSNTTI